MLACVCKYLFLYVGMCFQSVVNDAHRFVEMLWFGKLFFLSTDFFFPYLKWEYCWVISDYFVAYFVDFFINKLWNFSKCFDLMGYIDLHFPLLKISFYDLELIVILSSDFCFV